MSDRRIVVGQSEWTFQEGDAGKVVESVQTALEHGSVVRLELLDGAGRPVSVLLNGKAVPTVTIDLGGDPRPGEVSG